MNSLADNSALHPYVYLMIFNLFFYCPVHSEERYYGKQQLTPVYSQENNCYHVGLAGSAKTMICGDTATYHIKDRLGSTQVVIDEKDEQVTACSYGPHGVIDGIINQSHKTWCRYLDTYTWDEESSLYILPHRVYQPFIKRFLSQDALRYNNSAYTFANNNPISYIDKSGLAPTLAEQLYGFFNEISFDHYISSTTNKGLIHWVGEEHSKGYSHNFAGSLVGKLSNFKLIVTEATRTPENMPVTDNLDDIMGGVLSVSGTAPKAYQRNLKILRRDFKFMLDMRDFGRLGGRTADTVQGGTIGRGVWSIDPVEDYESIFRGIVQDGKSAVVTVGQLHLLTSSTRIPEVKFPVVNKFHDNSFGLLERFDNSIGLIDIEQLLIHHPYTGISVYIDQETEERHDYKMPYSDRLNGLVINDHGTRDYLALGLPDIMASTFPGHHAKAFRDYIHTVHLEQDQIRWGSFGRRVPRLDSSVAGYNEPSVQGRFRFLPPED